MFLTKPLALLLIKNKGVFSMILDFSDNSLAVYKSLANPTRLKMIRLLLERKYSVQEFVDLLGLSSPIVLKHLNMLADAGLIEFEKSGHKKIARLKINSIDVDFPDQIHKKLNFYEQEIPVGLYTNFLVNPSCGLADSKGFIGIVDDPKYFLDIKRVNANILWFAGAGFIEYQVLNLLKRNERVEMLTLSCEIGSEVPLSNSEWPSDITFFVNDTEVGTWTSPGDFGEPRGKYTPKWTPEKFNQYGTNITIVISREGTWVMGKRLSDVNLNNIDLLGNKIKLKLEVKKNATHKGGITIFGEHFGNFNENTKLRLYYS